GAGCAGAGFCVVAARVGATGAGFSEVAAGCVGAGFCGVAACIAPPGNATASHITAVRTRTRPMRQSAFVPGAGGFCVPGAPGAPGLGGVGLSNSTNVVAVHLAAMVVLGSGFAFAVMSTSVMLP